MQRSGCFYAANGDVHCAQPKKKDLKDPVQYILQDTQTLQFSTPRQALLEIFEQQMKLDNNNLDPELAKQYMTMTQAYSLGAERPNKA